ncbi:hypothetical protein AGLY_012864 [Aphis glycines]|uniref:Uncharacterized protein n=1 Tax=Aphis glycines TaxID=307491 RepID=A0A6G0T7V4_APHGL|nr:hypothetical protein AGLY_012864 [Aphis glycines]
MLNKDEFILYITQQYNQNDCCTPLEPIIWAVHFNIPKFQRLPVLENILLRSTAFIKKCYSFLPDKQIIGKTYEALGIPTVCGEPDKLVFDLQGAQYSSINSTASKANLEIICSTPNTKKVYSFNDSPLLSPIKTPIQEENHNLSTDSICNRDSVLIQNISKNNIVLDNKQIVAIPKILELSGFEMLNTSQQTLLSIQNGDISNINQSEIQFISGDPNYFQHENYNAKLNNSSLNNASKSSQDKSQNRKVKINSNRNTNSIYFKNNFKKVDYKVLDLKKEKSTNVIRQSLSEKLKKNILLFKKNKWVKKLVTSPSVNINMSNSKQIKYNVKKSTSESWTRINEAFNDILFSDFNGTSQTVMKHNQSKKMYLNEVEEDSSLEYYNTGENDVNNWYVESQNNNREEDSISSINSSTKTSNKLNDYDHKMYESSIFHSSLTIFSDTSVFSSNSTMNSEKLVSIQQQLISWTQDSSNTIDDEENYKAK